ncbi:MAG TPA: SDR family oxidoreductase [Pseudobacteroides sp.]|uniref:SDR family NAD(P)-dependent oxidoreductase n=1 Tax=Pseudobacteroides sp. TaxID=1968840 RepID=UPI002F948071
MNFKARVFIISGTNSGIGKACAEALLDNDAMVVGLDIKQASITHKRYMHYLLDVTDEEQVIDVLNEIDDKLGRVDGLANCAGIYASSKPFFELSITEWNKVIATNLTGVFILSKYTAQKMMKYKRGKIVNISCIRSKIFRSNMADYAASKGGVVALTSAMALDLSSHNIQVNSVAPGFTYTGMTAKSFNDPEIREFSESIIPVRRIAKPEDIANVALFLLSDMSDYINGETIFVDGGFKVSK